MYKGILAVLLVLYSAQSLSSTCKELVAKHFDTQRLAAKLFEYDKSVFSVILCKLESPSIYDVFYTQLHDANLPAHSVPSGSLSRIRQTTHIVEEARSTGFVVKERSGQHTYTVKLRARLATGEALDMSKTQLLIPKDHIIFEQQGITVGMLHL